MTNPSDPNNLPPPSGTAMNQTTDPLDNAITAPRQLPSLPVIAPVEIPGVPPPSPWPKRLGRAATLGLLFTSGSCAWYGYQAWNTGKEFIEILPVLPMVVVALAIMVVTLLFPIIVGMLKELVGDTSNAANKKPIVAQIVVSMIIAGVIVYLFDSSAGVVFHAVGTDTTKKLGFLSFLGWLGWTGHSFGWFRSLPALIEDEQKDTPLALWSSKSVWAASAIAGTGVAALFSHAYTWMFNSALHLLGASLACGLGLVLIAGLGGWMWSKSIRGAGKASSLYEQSKNEAKNEQSWFTLVKFVILVVELSVGLFIGLAMWPHDPGFGPYHLLAIVTGFVSFLITFSFVGSAVNMAYHKDQGSKKTWYAIGLSLLIATITGIFSSSEMYALVSRNDRFENEKAEILQQSNTFMSNATTPALVVAKALGGDTGKSISDGVDKAKSGVEQIRRATDREQLETATAEFMKGATAMSNRDDDRKLLTNIKVNPEPVSVQLFVDAMTSIFGGKGYLHKGALLAAFGLVFIFDFAALFAALITMARSPNRFAKAKSKQMLELEDAAEEAKQRAELAEQIAQSNKKITGTHQQPAPQSLLVTPTPQDVAAVSQGRSVIK